MSTLKVNALQNTSGSQLSRVIQTVRSSKKSKVSFSVNTLSVYDYTDFSISITPTVATNLIYITGFLNVGINGDGQDISIIPRRAGSDLTDCVGDQGDSNQRRALVNIQDSTGNHGSNGIPINMIYVPNTTSQQVINFAFFHGSGSTRVIYLNRSERDANNAENGTYMSQLVAQELVP
tara:strand:+ start:196 stop:729 length:534 start_codon:yes stop_codon:yes gene_type:complete